MKNVKVLFKNYGEISYTAMQPARPAEELPLDYTETDQRLFSSDDWRLTTCKVAEVRMVEIPDWMSPEFYVRNNFQLTRIWGAHKKAKETLSYDETCAMMRIIDSYTYDHMREAVKLLSANLKSAFRQKLKNQLVKWINGESSYSSPFSPRQWQSIMRFTRPRRY